MKAFMLGAGPGTRLRPLTNTVPKCLVPIRGKPLLAIWFELCQLHGITEVLINLHYLPDAVCAFIGSHDWGLTVKTECEPVLLGSAGAVVANRSFVAGEKRFFILYLDNLTNVDLGAMATYHDTRDGCLTMGLFRARNPKACGIVRLDGEGRVRAFSEKPETPESNLANAGIYVANEALFDYIPAATPCDFGAHVLPRLVGRMHGYLIEDYLRDIGTPEDYLSAQTDWPGVPSLMSQDRKTILIR
jgi:mannose-1-phosphate guanylyltransferase